MIVPLLASCLWLAPPVALPQAHSHNDYYRRRPLLDALEHGFGSVEADLILREGTVYVGHHAWEIRPERTLEQLYLAPLRAWIQAHGGRVYRDGPPLVLLLDFKTNADPTYAAVSPLLAKYADLLTEVRDGRQTVRAVTVLLSGSRPAKQELARQSPRYCALDGRPIDLNSADPVHLVPLISDAWKNHLSWNGTGSIPEEDRRKLTSLAARAHQAGRKLRLWGAPDRPEVWAAQLACGVDLINTDRLGPLRDFLLTANRRPAATPPTLPGPGLSPPPR